MKQFKTLSISFLTIAALLLVTVVNAADPSGSRAISPPVGATVRIEANWLPSPRATIISVSIACQRSPPVTIEKRLPPVAASAQEASIRLMTGTAETSRRASSPGSKLAKTRYSGTESKRGSDHCFHKRRYEHSSSCLAT